MYFPPAHGCGVGAQAEVKGLGKWQGGTAWWYIPALERLEAADEAAARGGDDEISE